jgi:hypothetical protein
MLISHSPHPHKNSVARDVDSPPTGPISLPFLRTYAVRPNAGESWVWVLTHSHFPRLSGVLSWESS